MINVVAVPANPAAVPLHGQSLRAAEIVLPPPTPWEVVRFGATVTVRDSYKVETRYRIVGVDEADAARGWVSWQSPIARALLHTRLSESVTFKFPSGESRLTIADIRYE